MGARVYRVSAAARIREASAQRRAVDRAARKERSAASSCAIGSIPRCGTSQVRPASEEYMSYLGY